jgi:hypothetical protein
LKVFLSWSGEKSKAAATALHGWLPTVIQTVRPYMSAENIDKGERWSVDISKQLEETHFGIICMTPENLEAPWVLFEAGPLSKSIEKARVAPLLFGIGPSEFTNIPLLQFQLTNFKKEDFARLLASLNAAASEAERLRPEVLAKSFERAWSELELDISKIEFSAARRSSPKHGGKLEAPTADKTVPADKLTPILDELLTIARSQMKVLRSPEDILPAPYVEKVFRRAVSVTRLPPFDSYTWRAVSRCLERLAEIARKLSDGRQAAVELLAPSLRLPADIDEEELEQLDISRAGPETTTN